MDAHPLDFDWRFTSETADDLVDQLLKVGGRCLVIGAPTIWKRLVRSRPADLVERNPIPQHDRIENSHVHSVFSVDICAAPQLRTSAGYDLCIFDSPWYIEDTKYWLAWALRNTVPGATIIFSLWPSDTRPAAAGERGEIFAILECLGEFKIREGALKYQIPEFERRALGVTSNWRFGDMVSVKTSLSNHRRLDFAPVPISEATWFRFNVSSRQVAIKAEERNDSIDILNLTPEFGWFMKTVSRRDPLRKYVDLWTSDGFVARLGNPMQTIRNIRQNFENKADLVDLVSRTAKNFGNVDFGLYDSHYWMMQEWQFVN